MKKYLLLQPSNQPGLFYQRITSVGQHLIAFAGYNAVWSDNSNYFGRILMDNTLTHREAMHMRTVCWMDYGTTLKGVKINREWPIYEVYMNHGC